MPCADEQPDQKRVSGVIIKINLHRR
jgi:hypothetical protein